MQSPLPDTILRKELSNKRVFSAINDEVDFQPHMHDYYEIAITIENNFIHTINGISFRPKRGDVVILRPSDTHSAHPTDVSLPHKLRDIYVPTEMFVSACNSIDQTLFEDLVGNNQVQPPYFNISASTLTSLDQRLSFPLFISDAAIHQENAQQIMMIQRAITVEILGYCVYESFLEEKKIPECVIKLINALQNPHFKEKKIEEMAVELNYSHTYLCRQFRSYFGKTLERYLIDERIDRSVSLLIQTDMSIEEIAQCLGWKKAENYSTTFQRVYGMPPTEYRKKNRSKK